MTRLGPTLAKQFSPFSDMNYKELLIMEEPDRTSLSWPSPVRPWIVNGFCLLLSRSQWLSR